MKLHKDKEPTAHHIYARQSNALLRVSILCFVFQHTPTQPSCVWVWVQELYASRGPKSDCTFAHHSVFNIGDWVYCTFVEFCAVEEAVLLKITVLRSLVLIAVEENHTVATDN